MLASRLMGAGRRLRTISAATAGAVTVATGAAASTLTPATAQAASSDMQKIAATTLTGLVAAATGGPLGAAAMAAATVGSVVTSKGGAATSQGSGSRAVVVAGPSGVGKGTLIAMLEKDMPGKFGFSVSHATRKPRPGEQDGVSYHFVTVPGMEAAIANDEFIEYAAGE